MAPALYLISTEKTPNSRQEPLKGRVIHAAISVEEPLWGGGWGGEKGFSSDFTTLPLAT